MKNDDQMFQSVLSRRNEYRERRKKRILTIKHTAPVLACFCLCAVLGLGYWNHFRNIPSIPVQPDVIDETTLEVLETTTSESENTSTTQITHQTEPVFITTPTSRDETDHISTTASIQTQTTAAVTDASESTVTQQVTGKQTETQASATTHLVTEPPPVITVPSSNHVTTALQTDITLTTMAIGELTVSISDTVTTIQTYLPTTGIFTTDQMTIMTDDTTTMTTTTSAFVPDPIELAHARELIPQLIDLYGLELHLWVADADAYPQYPNTVVIECNTKGVDGVLRIYAVQNGIDKHYFTFVYVNKDNPNL